MSVVVTVQFPKLHDGGQHAVFEDRHRFQVICAGRRWGKTLLGACKCIRTALRGGRAWWVAPSYKTTNVGWRALKELASQIPHSRIKEGARQILLPGGGSVEVRSADDPDSLRSEGLDGVVIDEAAYCLEAAWTQALRPSLSDRRGWALFISSPKGQANWFYRRWAMARGTAKTHWRSWRFPTWTNPFIVAEEIEAAREDMLAEHFSQEYGAQFVDLSHLKPFQADWLTDYDQLPCPVAKMYVVLGVDLAISQRDTACQTAMVVIGMPMAGPFRTTMFVLQANAGHWTPYESAGRFLKLCETWGVKKAVIEDVGWQRALKSIVEREASLAGKRVPHMELLRPELDKLRRALGASPLVEGQWVQFGPGQEILKRALLKVPEDKTGWDLTDAFGLSLAGFPRRKPDATRIESPEHAAAPLRRARSYATKTPTARSVVQPAAVHRHVTPGAIWSSPRGVRGGGRKHISRSYAVRLKM